MASSEREASPPSLELLSLRGATNFLLPWVIGRAAATNSAAREFAVVVHQPTRSLTLMEGPADLESIHGELAAKEGPSPASKASIESLPRVEITEPGMECAICLTEYEVGGEVEVKEMPCRHRFHSGCIDKWLGIHGSCPVCRFSMPVEEEEKKEGDGRDGDEWTIHVFILRGGRRPSSNADMGSGRVEDSNLGNDSNDAGENGNDELPAQHMEIN